MATPAQRTNTWTLDEWYAQAVAGTQGSYVGTGALYAWGDASVGGLGLNNQTDRSSPTQVPGTTWGTTFTSLDCGNQGASAIKTDGTLWAWGYNSYGELGFNNTTQYSSPKQVGTDTTWSTIARGLEFSLSTKTDGTLWAWGRNYWGQLGQNESANYYSSPKQIPGTSWKQIRQGANKSSVLAIKTNGTLWAWGYNTHTGCLGHNNETNYSSPRQVGTNTTWSECGRSTKNLSSAIKTDGTLWTWGSSNYGQLGLNQSGVPFAASSPTQVPGTTWSKCCMSEGSTLAVKTDGTLWVWGRKNWGLLGQNDMSINNQSSPLQIPGTTWDDCDVGMRQNFATKTDGTLWGWGVNGEGQLGQNSIIDPGPGDGISSPTQIPGSWGLCAVGGHSGTVQNILGVKLL
jgi:alpha-tubulin suppressor-like RCC1 family protein